MDLFYALHALPNARNLASNWTPCLHLQGIFFNAYFLAYILSPRSCHAFVGYLEEEAVKTYTHAIADLDRGRLPEWSNKKASCLPLLHMHSDLGYLTCLTTPGRQRATTE